MGHWWDNAVVYQIYPRSFQDSDGDGVGDLPGVEARLDHLTELGVDAFWLSPIYRSPMADGGYDVADHTAVDPLFGSLADLDRLIAAAHRRGLRVLLDLVPSHTSIEHPWFAEHPDRYVWHHGPTPPNNWVSTFGGPAWTRLDDTDRWYLHSFYASQPDLDWTNPAVVAAMSDVVRFWLQRGIDGFRIDAVDRLGKDPERRDELVGARPFPLPTHPDAQALEARRSHAAATVEAPLAALREAAGDALLVGEVYLPSQRLAPYLRHLDLAFNFEFLHAPWEAGAMAAAIDGAPEATAWAASNHDFRRAASRLGPEAARAALVLLLSLPGAAFLYQGEELGLLDGTPADPPHDRFGRDPHRSPIPWEARSPAHGFSEGFPWLTPGDSSGTTVAGARADPGSALALTRRLIELRRELSGPVVVRDAPAGQLWLERGEHTVAINTSGEAAPAPAGTARLDTHARPDPQTLAPWAATVTASGR